MSKRILICDDAAFMRNILKNILVKEADYEVVGEAENGNEAVNKAKVLNPDLILMDITMPEKNGLDALKEIRENGNHAKVLMCSAMGQKEIILQSIKEGDRKSTRLNSSHL